MPRYFDFDDKEVSTMLVGLTYWDSLWSFETQMLWVKLSPKLANPFLLTRSCQQEVDYLMWEH